VNFKHHVRGFSKFGDSTHWLLLFLLTHSLNLPTVVLDTRTDDWGADHLASLPLVDSLFDGTNLQ
jgi:hypothetical protein